VGGGNVLCDIWSYHGYENDEKHPSSGPKFSSEGGDSMFIRNACIYYESTWCDNPEQCRQHVLHWSALHISILVTYPASKCCLILRQHLTNKQHNQLSGKVTRRFRAVKKTKPAIRYDPGPVQSTYVHFPRNLRNATLPSSSRSSRWTFYKRIPHQNRVRFPFLPRHISRPGTVTLTKLGFPYTERDKYPQYVIEESKVRIKWCWTVMCGFRCL
jgi:hypothetical protein